MKHLLFIIFSITTGLANAQVNTNFTQFFVNPYLYNPSYAGADAQSVVILSYRNQWSGFEGAPNIGNLSFHAPAGKNVGLGLNFANERKSILHTNSAQLSMSYTLPMGENNFFRFGVSAGGAFNGVDITEFDDIDPAFAGIMENNLYLIGNAGISLQIKTFNFGISTPNIFTEKYVTAENFTVGEISPMEQLIISASNRFYLGGGKHVFEPAVLYHYSDVLPGQLEAAGVVHLNHVVWFGGSYKQDYGISAFGGLKIKQQMGIGYSYSIATSGINEIQAPTHEVHLSLLLGSKHKDRMAYSFVHTEKEKKRPVRKPVVAQKPVEPKPDPEPEPVVEEPEEEIVEETPQPEPEPEPEDVVKEEPETVGRTDAPVVVKKGNHALELDYGQYVVVGAFSNMVNAERYSDDLFLKGYPTRFGFTTEKGLFYVYLFKSENIQEARTERDRVRNNSLFSKAWVLTVE